MLYFLLITFIRMLAITLWRLRSFGQEQIPRKSPVLFVSNHQSCLDLILITVAQHRRLTYIARSTLYKSLIFRLLTFPFKIIKIERDKPDLQAVKCAIDILKDGSAILMFPEGTRTRTGKVGKIKMGFSTIARHSGATVIPVRISGAFEAWPASSKLPRFTPVKILFGQPIDMNQDDQKILCELQRHFSADLSKSLLEKLQNNQH